MKRFLALLSVLMMIFSIASAERVTVTGDISAQLVLTRAGIEWEYDGQSGRVYWTQEGQLLLESGEGVTVLLPEMPDLSAFSALMQALSGEQAFESARYSSLFTQARTIELGSHFVSALLLPLLQAFPGAEEARSLLEIAQGAPEERWGELTCFSADARQYPNTALWQFNLNAPELPAVYAELRTDDVGATFKLALESANVSDWDETMLAIEEGRSAQGWLLRGFTLILDDEQEKNTYVEANFFRGGMSYLLEADIYAQPDGSSWYALVVLLDGGGNLLLNATVTGFADAELGAIER